MNTNADFMLNSYCQCKVTKWKARKYSRISFNLCPYIAQPLYWIEFESSA